MLPKADVSLQQKKLLNLELKYRKTLILNPLSELPEFNNSEEDENASFDELSKDLSIKPPSD